ncbi:hypothetical protein C8Q78DRAFT_258681 [Trametes maxima]|nr:hypothetical protein C8Q78DRAFT_258681 [Trametes maxima]
MTLYSPISRLAAQYNHIIFTYRSLAASGRRPRSSRRVPQFASGRRAAPRERVYKQHALLLGSRTRELATKMRDMLKRRQGHRGRCTLGGPCSLSLLAYLWCSPQFHRRFVEYYPLSRTWSPLCKAEADRSSKGSMSESIATHKDTATLVHGCYARPEAIVALEPYTALESSSDLPQRSVELPILSLTKAAHPPPDAASSPAPASAP